MLICLLCNFEKSDPCENDNEQQNHIKLDRVS